MTNKKLKTITSLFFLFFLLFMAIENLAQFLDLSSLTLVLGGGLLFSFSGEYTLKTRVINFGIGALIITWIGTLIGFIQILADFEVLNAEQLIRYFRFPLICLFYGYLMRAISFIVAENLFTQAD